uniref:Lysophospholipid acyltransferase 5 n=2 Tax=Lutzomyia longipalpis TaxID=7200 RepID=A0A1B0CHD0_LUTLO
MSSPGLIGQLAGAVGATEPALRLLISVVLGYPLSLFYRNFIWPLPELQQHIFMIISGMTICLFNYGSDVYHSILAILATYILIKVLGPTKKLMIASFAFHMTHLLFGYIMTGTDNYDIVWTMPHCVLVLRLIGLTFDICDTFGSHKKGDEPKEMDVYGIKKMPNLLQISSYTYFPGSFLAGPQFPYHQYERFLGKEFEKYQGFVDAGLKRFGLGFMYLAIFQILNIFASDTYLLSEDYASAGYFKRLIFLGIWGRLTLYKYMSVWLLSEGVCTRFGLTFRNVKEGKEDWSAGENVKIWRLEQANRFTHYIESFNVATNHWFDSIVKGNEKLRRLLEHPHLQPVYFVLLKFYAIVGMGWCLVPFAFLSFSKYWAIFRAVHFLGYVYALAYIGIHFILKALFPRDKSRAVPEKSQ